MSGVGGLTMKDLQSLGAEFDQCLSDCEHFRGVVDTADVY
jgi:hypothetical protein